MIILGGVDWGLTLHAGQVSLSPHFDQNRPKEPRILTAETVTKREALSPAELIPLLASAAEAAGALGARAKEAVKAKVSADGKIDNMALEREQHAAHGLAWIATYVEAIRQIADYAKRMDGDGRFGEMEASLSQIGAGE
jgi:hypothetical protein